jgi:CDP-glucose 4,6-dehydratase
MNPGFWKDKKVLLTGHTGFKGSWLSIWLRRLQARVTGYALPPPTPINLFEVARVGDELTSVIGDVRDLERLRRTFDEHRPEIVFHMAAQPLVHASYRLPVETYAVNVMGTVNLFESVRSCPSVKAVVNVTTDKCYENHEWAWGYRENEALGGRDPYSNSKACSELVTAAYRQSYFRPDRASGHGVAIATARAGNVIGGGDWAADRLVPDCMLALMEGRPARIRNPRAIRPWQHVLDPLSGYLVLAQRLYEGGGVFAEAWNFGPSDENARSVEWLVQRICDRWGEGSGYEIDPDDRPGEAHSLRLDSSKARSVLGWRPRLDLDAAVSWSLEWYRAFANGEDVRRLTGEQLAHYEGLPS